MQATKSTLASLLASVTPDWPSVPSGNVRGALYWVGRDVAHYADHPNLMTWDGNTDGPMVFVRFYPAPKGTQ
jgi:hypothetical protein